MTNRQALAEVEMALRKIISNARLGIGHSICSNTSEQLTMIADRITNHLYSTRKESHDD